MESSLFRTSPFEANIICSIVGTIEEENQTSSDVRSIPQSQNIGILRSDCPIPNDSVNSQATYFYVRFSEVNEVEGFFSCQSIQQPNCSNCSQKNSESEDQDFYQMNDEDSVVRSVEQNELFWQKASQEKSSHTKIQIQNSTSQNRIRLQNQYLQSSSLPSRQSQREQASNQPDRDYLKGKRAKKGSIKGPYPTKNMLPWVKRILKKLIIQNKKQEVILKDQKLSKIFDHISTVRKEILQILQHPDLNELWKNTFRKRILYDQLNESKKIKPQVKLAYKNYLDTLQHVFKTKKFQKLTIIRTEELRMLNQQPNLTVRQ